MVNLLSDGSAPLLPIDLVLISLQRMVNGKRKQ